MGVTQQQQMAGENAYIILGTTKYDSQTNIPMNLTHSGTGTDLRQFPRRPTTTNNRIASNHANRSGLSTSAHRSYPNRQSINSNRNAGGSRGSFTKYVTGGGATTKGKSQMRLRANGSAYHKKQGRESMVVTTAGGASTNMMSYNQVGSSMRMGGDTRIAPQTNNLLIDNTRNSTGLGTTGYNLSQSQLGMMSGNFSSAMGSKASLGRNLNSAARRGGTGRQRPAFSAHPNRAGARMPTQQATAQI